MVCHLPYNSRVLIDTHNHLYFEQFDADRADVLARMSEAGVRGAVVIGIDPPSWEAAYQLACVHPQLHYAVGLHPTSSFPDLASAVQQTNEPSGDLLAPLREYLDRSPAPVAVGECGIDLYWKADDPRVTWAVNPLDAQCAVFIAQLELARDRDLPVIVHTRAADRNTLDCLLAVPGTRGVLHCFNGSPELLAFALGEPGWFVSFAGNVTYKKATELHGPARDIPLERLLVETDAPFMAPAPYRGQRNEPGYVAHTAQHIAELRGISLEEVAEQTTRNAQALFRTSWVR